MRRPGPRKGRGRRDRHTLAAGTAWRPRPLQGRLVMDAGAGDVRGQETHSRGDRAGNWKLAGKKEDSFQKERRDQRA